VARLCVQHPNIALAALKLLAGRLRRCAALIKATEEMGDRASFKGYGPEQGYAFLREAIAQHDFVARGLHEGVGPTVVVDHIRFLGRNVVTEHGEVHRFGLALSG